MTRPPDDRHSARRQLILDTFRKTGSITATARQLHAHRRTVRLILNGEKDRSTAPRTTGPRPSKLDPFKATISRLVLDDQLTATLILEELRPLGYTGGYSTLKRYVRSVRPKAAIKVTNRIDHPPGSPAQVDWSPHTVQLGGEQRIVHCFSFVLPFSRYMFVRYATDEQLDTLVALHEEAFLDLRGVPLVITYDNMTTVGRHAGPGQINITARFEEYAKQTGFEIFLIDPGKPNQHASVERPFHYVENNFLKRHRKTFTDLADLNERARHWCENIANVRLHGTTRERPVDRLKREKVFLKPVPHLRPETFRTLARQVGTDFCVAVDTNRYSVPPRHAGQPATVHLFNDRLEILIGGQLVATHPLATDRHGRCVLTEHETEFKNWTPSRRLLETAFLRLGPAAHDFYQGLLTQRGKGAGYHLQRILKIADRHGSDVVTAAMRHAAQYGNFSAEAVARVVAGKQMPRTQETQPASPPPEQVRRWLEGLDVEVGDLGAFDEMVDRAGFDKEQNDGQG